MGRFAVTCLKLCIGGSTSIGVQVFPRVLPLGYFANTVEELLSPTRQSWDTPGTHLYHARRMNARSRIYALIKWRKVDRIPFVVAPQQNLLQFSQNLLFVCYCVVIVRETIILQVTCSKSIAKRTLNLIVPVAGEHRCAVHHLTIPLRETICSHVMIRSNDFGKDMHESMHSLRLTTEDIRVGN